MESKTLLLDLVQQRKDGRITQEEMVRQLVELRNQDTGASSLATANASAVAAPADQRASIHADIERQRQEKLAAKQKDGAGSDPRQAWGPPSPSASPSLAPPPAASMPPGAREASTIARSYCSAVGAQHRDARSVFDAYDTSRSGVITFEDLRRGVRNDPSMSKSGLTDTDLRQVFSMMDRSHNDSITAIEFEEFLSGFVAGPKPSSARGRSAAAVSNSTVAGLRRKFRAAAYTQGGVHWKSLFDFYDKDNNGALDYEEFARAVRRDGKVTRGAMSDRELRQLFGIVDHNSTGSVSAEDFEKFLQGGNTKSSARGRDDARQHETSGGWDGTETDSDASYPVGGRVSSQASFSTDPSFQRGQRVARMLKAEEDAKCTFAPEISQLPAKLYSSRDSITDAPVEQRAHQWLEKREQKLSAERRKAEDNETSGCTFHPRISPGTKSRQNQARTGRTREMEFERLYSEKLGRDHAKSKKSELPDSRDDGGSWFRPKINDSGKALDADNYAKPVVRKVGAVTQQLLNEREGENTFKPQTNHVSAKFSCASEYLADSAFDRLSRPSRTLPGDTAGSSGLNTSGERLFDSVYDLDGDTSRRAQLAKPATGSAPRMRATPTRRDGDATSDISVSAAGSQALYEKGQAWAERRQSKMERVAKKVEEERQATVVRMSKKTKKLAVERRDGSFLDRVQADTTQRETHAYKHAELRAADDNCTFKPHINKSSKHRHGRSVEELSRGDAAHNLDLKEELEKQNRLAEQRTLTFKPSVNPSVTVPGRLQLHTKEGRESYLDRIKEAESDITKAIEERRIQQEREELDECTFRPEIRDAPQYVKRIANSMKLTRAAKPAPEKTNYSFLSTREH